MKVKCIQSITLPYGSQRFTEGKDYIFELITSGEDAGDYKTIDDANEIHNMGNMEDEWFEDHFIIVR